MRRAVGVLVLLGGCGGSDLEGAWFGQVACGGDRVFAATLDVSDVDDDRYEAVGELRRETVDPSSRKITETVVSFTVGITQDGGDAQTLVTRFACVSEVVTQYLSDRSEPTVLQEACSQGRFRGYDLDWDGAGRLTMRGPDGCRGTLALR